MRYIRECNTCLAWAPSDEAEEELNCDTQARMCPTCHKPMFPICKPMQGADLEMMHPERRRIPLPAITNKLIDKLPNSR